VLLRLLSIGLAIVQFHDFRLGAEHGALAVESGLLTRVRARAPLRKVQFWTVSETLLHRAFHRRSLAVETAVVHTGGESSRSIHHLAPVATPDTTTAIVQRLLPQAGYPAFDWQPLHPAAWKRMSVWPVLVMLVACAALTLRFGPAGLLLLALLPWWILRARKLAAATGWALNGDVVAFRSGWLDRKVSFAELAKLQGVQLLHTPFDRRRGMATVVVDTAGAGALGHRIHIRYLPAEVARALANRLGRHIARSPLAW
jgi:putative membrane protein